MENCTGLVVRRLRACVARLLLVALALGGAAHAEVGNAAVEQQVRELALQGARSAAAGRRIEVAVGQLDARLRLAPCDTVEPYLPSGAKLWGRTRIGLRCTAGPSRWNVYLPVTVKVWGRALVAAGPLPSGTVLAATDVTTADVDLAEESSPALLEPAAAVGRTLAQPLKPGQGVREANLKPRVWFEAGQTVQVVSRGAGYSVAVEGQALTPGVEGQSARVRQESGRMLTGRPVGPQRMEVGP